jgi:hypothetical protein
MVTLPPPLLLLLLLSPAADGLEKSMVAQAAAADMVGSMIGRRKAIGALPREPRALWVAVAINWWRLVFLAPVSMLIDPTVIVGRGRCSSAGAPRNR